MVLVNGVYLERSKNSKANDYEVTADSPDKVEYVKKDSPLDTSII